MKRALLISLLAVIGGLCGCHLMDSGVSVLVTNRPEFAAYVEAFNSSQQQYKVILKYADDPVNSLLMGDEAELVVAEGLANTPSLSRMSPLTEILVEQDIDSSLFYSDLWKTGVYMDEVRLLPVSFDLPLIIHRKGQQPGSHLISINEIQSYYLNEGKNIASIRFSPWWNPELLYLESLRDNASYSEAEDKSLHWDQDSLDQTLIRVGEFSSEVNDSVKAEKIYREKYLYEPVYLLLEKERIDFALADLNDFFSYPDGEKSKLDYTFYGWDEQIPVRENILYAGLAGESRNTAAAEAFLGWFFQPETQIELLKEMKIKRIDTFGIGQGLSAFISVTELEYVVEYPWLVGKVPRSEHLVFAQNLPLGWVDIKQEVVVPWLERAFVIGKESIDPFQQDLKTWYLQNNLVE